MKPLVSVIIPVFNGECYIGEALESILKQSYKNLEVIIINDGSNDRTHTIINTYKDKRIKYINRENKGLSKTLIELVEKANGSLIARMDADDIADKFRIEKQVTEFNKNKKLVLIGSNVDYIDDKGGFLGSSLTVGFDNLIRKKMKSGNIFFHPTVMFKKQAYIKAGGYDSRFEKYIEDYLLWVKLMAIGEVKILPQSLLKYRLHDNAISSSSPVGLHRVIEKISTNHGCYPDLEEDYEKLIKKEKVYSERTYGYKVNKYLKPIFIKLIEFKLYLSKGNE